MSYRREATFLLVAILSVLMLPVHSQSTPTTSPEASKPSEVSKPATAAPGTSAASAPAPAGSAPATAPTAGSETVAAEPPAQDQGQVVVPGGKAILLKPGDKLPERKHPEYESWSTPYLPKTMKGEDHVMAKGERATFTRELVGVQWRDLDPIDLWVIRPKGVKNPPVILYLYGFPTNNARYKDDDFCAALTRNGFAAIGFVSAVTGQRFHDRPGRQWFVSELQEALGSTVHDVQLVLNYLERRGGFDMSRVGIWGNGSGASIAIMAAAVDPRIKVLDLLNPWGDWPDWLAKSSLIPEKERPNYLSPFFLSTVKDLEPVDWLPQLKDRQVRLQYISEGMTVTPPEAKKRMEAAAPPNVEIVHYQTAQEFAQKVDSGGRRFDWIRDQLGTLGEAREASNPANQDKSPRQP